MTIAYLINLGTKIVSNVIFHEKTQSTGQEINVKDCIIEAAQVREGEI